MNKPTTFLGDGPACQFRWTQELFGVVAVWSSAWNTVELGAWVMARKKGSLWDKPELAMPEVRESSMKKRAETLWIPVMAAMCEEYQNSSAGLADQKVMPKG